MNLLEPLPEGQQDTHDHSGGDGDENQQQPQRRRVRGIQGDGPQNQPDDAGHEAHKHRRGHHRPHIPFSGILLPNVHELGSLLLLHTLHLCQPAAGVQVGELFVCSGQLLAEGAHVKAVAELLPYSGGLARNLVQCLDDYDIPLLLSHTVVEIKGRERVTGVVIAKVDENRRPIPGTETLYECDTLLLSCGLIPENELSREAGAAISPVTAGPVVTDDLQTSIEGVFACGNVLHVHDLVDYVSEEAANAGKQAAQYLQKQNAAPAGEAVPIVCEGGVRYTVPQALRPKAMPEKLTVRFRVQAPMKNRVLTLRDETGRVLLQQKKKHLAPGEMEQIVLKKEVLCAESAPKRLTLSLEEET